MQKCNAVDIFFARFVFFGSPCQHTGVTRSFKLEFHDADTDTDILARILADTSDTRDFLKLFLF